MFKHLVPLMLIAVLFVACGKKDAAHDEAMTVGALLEQPENFIDQEVTLAGTVTHICKHGGKRLHLTDLEADQKIRVETGDRMEAFTRELEGSDIIVTGILRETRIDEAYLSEWEDELLAAAEEEGVEDEEGQDHGSERHAGDSEQMKEHEQDMASEDGADDAEDSVIEEGDADGHVEPQGMDAIREIREELKASGKDYLSRWHIDGVSYKVVNQAEAAPAEDGHDHDGDHDHEH